MWYHLFSVQFSLVAQSCPTLCDPMNHSTPGLPAAAAKSLQSCPTLCNPIDGSPPGSPTSLGFSRQDTGVGCHFLLQCMKVKSESEVAHLCLTLSDPMDCSPPGSSIHGFSRQEYWSGVPLPSLNMSTTHFIVRSRSSKVYLLPIEKTW